MKTNAPKWVLLFALLVTASFHIRAQESEADRTLFKEIKAKAEKGDSESQLRLGAAFFFGHLGVEEDHAQAVKWYRKAADQNYAPAQSNLGGCYLGGQGVAKDFAEAVKWYRKAADQRYAVAQYNLGVCYSRGEGVARDEAEAVKWYRKAA